MKPKKIVIDLDSTGVDINSKWLGTYNKLYNDSLTNEDLVKWEMHEYVKPECGLKIYDIIAQPGFFRDLPAYPGFIELVKHLHEAVDPVTGEKKYLPIIATAYDHDQAATDKAFWLKQNLPFLHKKQKFLGHGKEHIPAWMFIDDGPHNVEAYRAENPDAHILAMEWPYNTRVEDLCLRLPSYKDPAKFYKSVLDYIAYLEEKGQ